MKNQFLFRNRLTFFQETILSVYGSDTSFPAEYPVKVKVVENSRLLDEDTYLVNIPLPELHLKLEYEVESKNTSDVYRIYGYLINKGLSSAKDVSHES